MSICIRLRPKGEPVVVIASQPAIEKPHVRVIVNKWHNKVNRVSWQHEYGQKYGNGLVGERKNIGWPFDIIADLEDFLTLSIHSLS